MAIDNQIAEIAKKVGFEVVKEKDLGKPPAKPWWTRLKIGRFAYWRNHILILAFLGIALKGVVDVHEMLFKTADYLVRGGEIEIGIFTPMHMILCRKPEKKTAN
ncbi:24-methylenesterol C-methyltransferase 2 [Camellia lanceoleosa]|uniref:24-methylenesterol C-methyltransferase 2 n=1 Tax=Camellia lanceoleosa TaxID=1840588 RepID=A0ACC0GSN4_9ERIC|nr:24-methylenesterol C-methyltransferase 2 [Camellia lanceoleosa]